MNSFCCTDIHTVPPSRGAEKPLVQLGSRDSGVIVVITPRGAFEFSLSFVWFSLPPPPPNHDMNKSIQRN